MNKIAERLAEILDIPVKKVINDIDKNMWEILIELNRKHYYTYACCEGHLNENNFWNGYIAFKQPYNFKDYPKDYDSARQRKCFYWSGNGEESRKEFLVNLYEWALNLPIRKIKEIKSYTLWGKNIHRPNSNWKILRTSNNFDDIRIELNRKQTGKYDIKIEEQIVGRI